MLNDHSEFYFTQNRIEKIHFCQLIVEVLEVSLITVKTRQQKYVFPPCPNQMAAVMLNIHLSTTFSSLFGGFYSPSTALRTVKLCLLTVCSIILEASVSYTCFKYILGNVQTQPNQSLETAGICVQWRPTLQAWTSFDCQRSVHLCFQNRKPLTIHQTFP